MQKTIILSLFVLLFVPAYSSDLPTIIVDSSTAVQPFEHSLIDTFSSKKKRPKLLKQSIVPLSLAATGLTMMAIPNLKQDIQSAMNWNQSEDIFMMDDELRFLPTATMALMSVFQANGKHKLWEQLVLSGSTYILSDLFVYRLKTATKIRRPYPHVENESFPSQHAAMAFLAASMLQKEFGDRYPLFGIGGYVVAGWVGYARVARNRHFVPDVLVGASIGMLSANLTYWLYETLQERFKKPVQIQSSIGKDAFEIRFLCTL